MPGGTLGGSGCTSPGASSFASIRIATCLRAGGYSPSARVVQLGPRDRAAPSMLA